MKTIFIVDDEYSIVESLTDLLVEEGYRVASAINGRDALAAISVQRPDLVLTDLMMPAMDGRQLLAHMREDPGLHEIPAILMSAASLPRNLDEFNGIPVFRKPFQIDALLAEIARLLATTPPATSPPDAPPS